MKELNTRIIGLLTDFGPKSSHYIAAMKGVLLKVNPNAKIIDIIHSITPYSIIEASYVIKTIYKYYPENSIFVVVIDPDVGSSREILALKTESNYFFVGPNNGIFSNSFNEKIIECVKVENDKYFHKPVSKTFHGRDIMAPVAAYISNGVSLNEFGQKFNINDLNEFVINYEVLEQDKKILSTIQYIDSFGNITTNIPLDQDNNIIGTDFCLNKYDIISIVFKDKQYESKFTTYFKAVSVNSLITLKGSGGYLEISVNRGNAAKMLGIKVGDIIRVILGGKYIHPKELLACIKEKDLKYLHSGQITKFIFPMERDLAHKKKISHLIVRLFIISISPENEILYLVQKRSKDKESYPDYFTDSASGHIIWTKSLNLKRIKQNAIRELQEEFGIPPNKIKKLKFYELSPLEDYLTKEISYTFFGLIEYNTKLKPDPTELDTEASRFYTKTELKDLLENEEAIDYSKRIWERMLNMDLISFFEDSSKLNTTKEEGVALFIGRFQPLHHGHIYVIKKILKSYSLIKIGIGSSQASHKAYNPFTSEERKEFIVEALKKRNILSDRYKIYDIPDIFNAKEWVDHVISIVGEFNVIFSNSDWVSTLFKSKGYKVGQKITIFTKRFNGSNIRNLINQDKEEWKRLVPTEVIKLMKSFNGIERIKSLFEKSESA